MTKSLLYFYADWCNPCKAMKPTIETLEKEFEVRRINIESDDFIEWKATGIKMVPSFVVLDSNQKEVFRHAGSMSLNNLRMHLNV